MRLWQPKIHLWASSAGIASHVLVVAGDAVVAVIPAVHPPEDDAVLLDQDHAPSSSGLDLAAVQNILPPEDVEADHRQNDREGEEEGGEAEGGAHERDDPAVKCELAP